MKNFSLFILIFLSTFVQAQDRLTIVREENTYGLKQFGKWEVKPKFDSIIRVSDDCFILKKKELFGIYRYNALARKGNSYELVKPKYTSLIGPVNSYFALSDKKDSYALFLSYKQISRSFDYQKIILQEKYQLLQLKNGQWKYEYKNNSTNKRDSVLADSVVVIGQQAFLFSGKIIKLTGSTKESGFTEMAFVDEDGSVKKGLTYDPDLGKKPIILIGQNEKAITNEKGVKISPWYKNITLLKNGDYLTENSKRFGILSKDLKFVIERKFDTICLEEDYYFTRKDEITYGWFGFANGKKSIYEMYDRRGALLTTSNVPFKKMCPGKYLASEKIFNTEIKKYDGIVYPTEAKCGIYRVKKDSTYYYLDTSGKKISEEYPAWYERHYERDFLDMIIGMFSVATVIPAVAIIANGGDPFGNGNASLEKNYGGEFFENRAMVGLPNEKGVMHFGYIDTSMKIVIPLIYDDAAHFIGEIAFVKKNEYWAIINKSNVLKSGFIYADYDYFGDNLIIVERRSRTKSYSFINNKGEKTKLPDFSSYSRESDGTITIEIDLFPEKKYSVTKSGEMKLLDK